MQTEGGFEDWEGAADVIGGMTIRVANSASALDGNLEIIVMFSGFGRDGAGGTNRA